MKTTKTSLFFLTAIVIISTASLTFAVSQYFFSIRGTFTPSNTLVLKDGYDGSPITEMLFNNIEAGGVYTFPCTIQNDGNTPLRAYLNVTAWTPTIAGDYLTLSWDFEGRLVQPNEGHNVIFTLTVSADASGFTGWSATGQIEGRSNV